MIGTTGTITGTVVKVSYQHNAIMLDAEMERDPRRETLVEVKFPWDVELPKEDQRITAQWRIGYGDGNFVPTVWFDAWEEA